MTFIYDNRDISKSKSGFYTRFVWYTYSNFDKGFPENKELKMNHQHIFCFTILENNGFSLNKVQDGLEVLTKLFNKIKLIKKLKYLENGIHQRETYLIHSDYVDDWLYVNEKRFIDPEFSFII